MAASSKQTLVDKHQQFNKDVEIGLDGMANQLKELQDIGLGINTALDEDGKKLSDLGNKIDDANTNLDNANSRLNKFLKFVGNNKPYYICIGILVLILIIMFVILGFAAKN